MIESQLIVIVHRLSVLASSLSTAERGFMTEKDLLSGGHGGAGLDVAAEVGQYHFERGQARDHVELVHVAHVADPDDLPLELVLAADGRDAEPFGELAADVS